MLKNTIGDFLKKGKEKEDELIQLLHDQSLNVEKSNPSQDKNEHWDIQILNDIKIDVKGLKKSSRDDIHENENYHWIELKAVSESDNKKRKGWLYAEEVDYFAFETNDYWILVEKNQLQEFIALKCKDKIKTDNPQNSLYKFYSRKGRNDLLTKVKTLDLCYLSDKILQK